MLHATIKKNRKRVIFEFENYRVTPTEYFLSKTSKNPKIKILKRVKKNLCYRQQHVCKVSAKLKNLSLRAQRVKRSILSKKK